MIGKNHELNKEMKKLMKEMDSFDEYYRHKVCNVIKDHKTIHKNVIKYPSGKIYCDQLRNAKSRKFRQRSFELLAMISDLQK